MVVVMNESPRTYYDCLETLSSVVEMVKNNEIMSE